MPNYLDQDTIDALNNAFPIFQNVQLGTLLDEIGGGVLPTESITGTEIALLTILAGNIANGAINNDKLASNVKVGSLALLGTTLKDNLVNAINEVNLKVGINEAYIDGLRVSVISKKFTLNGVNPTPINFGVDLSATVTSTNSESYDLTGVGDGGTIIVNPDGAGNETATVNFAVASSISGASPSTDISASVDNKFDISVDGDSAEEVVLTIAGGLNSGANIATELQTRIQALGGNKASVTVDYNVTEAGKYAILSPTFGTNSGVVITPASTNNITEELKIGTADGGAETAGTGDVADATAVTASELATVCNGDMTGLTVNGDSGSVIFTSDTTGKDSSLVIGAGTLDAVIGITNASEYYGAQGFGLTDYTMDDTNYLVIMTLNGVASASLGAMGLSYTSKTTLGFDIECETAGATADVDVILIPNSNTP